MIVLDMPPWNFSADSNVAFKKSCCTCVVNVRFQQRFRCRSFVPWCHCRKAIILPHCNPCCTHWNTCIDIYCCVQTSSCAISTCVDKYAAFRPVDRFAFLLHERVSVCTCVDSHVNAAWIDSGSNMLAFVSLRHLYSTLIYRAFCSSEVVLPAVCWHPCAPWQIVRSEILPTVPVVLRRTLQLPTLVAIDQLELHDLVQIDDSTQCGVARLSVRV